MLQALCEFSHWQLPMRERALPSASLSQACELKTRDEGLKTLVLFFAARYEAGHNCRHIHLFYQDRLARDRNNLAKELPSSRVTP